MNPLILVLLVLGLVIAPTSEISYARSGPKLLLWDTGADITPKLKAYLEKWDYHIQPFDLLPAIDSQGPVQLASDLVNVGGVVTTVTQLRRLLNKVLVLKAKIILADVPSIVHVLLREPSGTQPSCSPQGADIRCLRLHGPNFITTHGSSANAAAVITTILPDLAADCETGTNCKQIGPAGLGQEFASFLAPVNPQGVQSPHVVVYMAEILKNDRNDLVAHTVSLPGVEMVALESVAAAMKFYGFYPTTIAAKTYGDVQTSPVLTVQNLTVLVSFSADLLSGGGTQDMNTRDLRAQRGSSGGSTETGGTTGGTTGGPTGGNRGGGAPDRLGSGQNSASLILGLGDLVPKEVRRIMLQHLLDFQYSSGKRVELDNNFFEFLRKG